MPPIYDRKCFNLTKQQRINYEKEGRKPHYRFYLGRNNILKIDDSLRGQIEFNVNNLSDPVVVKSDGSVTYLLSSVIDDVEAKVTDIIRGEDHISNTPLQVLMFKALNAKVPRFCHFGLI